VSRMLGPLPLIIAVIAFAPAAHAHRLDEFLQATIVDIGPGDVRLRINLTPGAAVAEPIVTLIDRDRDGAVSAAEASAYCESFRRDLTLRLDGRDVTLKVASSSFPPPADLRTGWGTIQIELTAALGPRAAGAHSLTLEDRHLPQASAYLFNAAQPRSDAVRITRQARNENQSTGEIDYLLRPEDSFRSRWRIDSLAALLLTSLAVVWRARTNSAASI